jgi:hypothetical protein
MRIPPPSDVQRSFNWKVIPFRPPVVPVVPYALPHKTFGEYFYLDDYHFKLATRNGHDRQDAEEYKAANGFTVHESDGSRGKATARPNNCSGSCMECGAQLWLGHKYQPTLNTYDSRPDLKGPVDVRSTRFLKKYPYLPVYERERHIKQGHLFVLVENLRGNRLGRILGWEYGRVIMARKQVPSPFGEHKPEWHHPLDDLQPWWTLREAYQRMMPEWEDLMRQFHNRGAE